MSASSPERYFVTKIRGAIGSCMRPIIRWRIAPAKFGNIERSFMSDTAKRFLLANCAASTSHGKRRISTTSTKYRLTTTRRILDRFAGAATFLARFGTLPCC